MLQAYNDWHIDEWCAAHPGCFMPLSILPLWDMDAVVEELKRVAAKGACAVTMPELPHLQGFPTYQSDWCDPFFIAMCDLDVVMCLNIGQVSTRSTCRTSISTISRSVLPRFRSSPSRISFWGPTFRKYPGLKVALSEGGIGCIPFLLDRVARHHENQPGPDRTSVRSRRRYPESAPSPVSSPTSPP
jgi:predicted TIM-barrel fold metal-dependent hydrolase